MTFPESFAVFERYWLERPIAERFALQVSQRPQQTAVSDATATLSYAELDRAANRVARRLLAL